MIPGRALHRFAARVCTARALERVVEPAIADLQKEYADANGRGLHRGWLLLIGYLSVWRVMVLSTPGMFTSTSEDNAATVRVLSVAVASTVAVIVLLMIPLAAPWKEFIGLRQLALLVPQAVPLAIPIGLVFGCAFGLGGRAVSRGGARMVVLAALAFSTISFGTLAWGLPAASQAFRQHVFTETGNPGTPMKGFNAMTFRELESEIANAKAIGNDQSARRGAWHYHLKSSLASAPFVLAMFALATAGRGRARSHTFVLLSPVAYWLLMFAGHWLGIRTSTPPSVGAWLPNIAFAATAMLVLMSRSSCRPNSSVATS